MVGAWLCYLLGNDREASAIVDAGGDAGLWGVGIVVVSIAMVPSLVMLLLSLVKPRLRISAIAAIVSGCLSFVVTVWLTASVSPPARVTDEGLPLDHQQWNQAADAYQLCVALLGAAGGLAVVGGLATLRHRARGLPAATSG